MESVFGESNGWGYTPSYRPAPTNWASESVSGESVTDIIPRYPNTPRITELKKELSFLKAELINAERKAAIRKREEEAEHELLEEINQIKQKIKKIPR